jgi:P27 family predicted phage terminase small subunit
MGARGPKRLDPRKRKNRGTLRPSDHLDHPSATSAGAAVAPTWLAKSEKEEFDRVVQSIQSVCGSADQNLIARYVHTLAQWREAQQSIEADGAVTDTRDSRGRKRKGTQSPWLLVAFKINEQLIKMESLLGMTPASRQRMVGGASAPPAEDPGEGIFKKASRG